MVRKTRCAGAMLPAMLVGLLSGCATQQSSESTMASTITPHVHEGLVLVDDQAGLPGVDPDAWETARNDNPGLDAPASVLPGATLLERRRRDRLHSSNGRPHNHFFQTTEIREHRIRR